MGFEHTVEQIIEDGSTIRLSVICGVFPNETTISAFETFEIKRKVPNKKGGY